MTRQTLGDRYDHHHILVRNDCVLKHSRNLPGTMTPWVVVAILSVIIVVSLVVLFLFCCKERMTFLSGKYCSGLS